MSHLLAFLQYSQANFDNFKILINCTNPLHK